jgi:UDP-N-acetylglucosamine 2-epimerase (non-hydrolysing)
MVVIVYGTTGELIKILPLIKSIPENEQLRINTNQQPAQLARLMSDADLPEAHITLSNGAHGHDLEKMSDLVKWAFVVAGRYMKNRGKIKSFLKQPGNHLFIVHGDTITTVFGALIGRLHRQKVAHIEAGLRSFNWRHPFPEELDRIVVSKLARYHYSPGSVPIENLHKAKVKGLIVDTKRNTVLDSLRLAQASDARDLDSRLDTTKPYYVVSIHRNELLSNEESLKGLLQSIRNHADVAAEKAVYLDHPVTKERLDKLGYNDLLDHSNIIRIPKLSYYKFIQLVSKSQYIVTDSGGLQEEAAYLNIPCLVHRMATERQEGIGQNVVLSLYDQATVDAFLKDPSAYRGEEAEKDIKPTEIIVASLRKLGFIS